MPDSILDSMPNSITLQSILIEKIKRYGISEEISNEIAIKIAKSIISIIELLQFHPTLLKNIINVVCSPEVDLELYYEVYYSKLIEQSKSSSELQVLAHVANQCLSLKELLEGNITAIAEKFFNEICAVEAELTIHENKISDFFCDFIKNITKYALEIVNNKLSDITVNILESDINNLTVYLSGSKLNNLPKPLF